MTLEHTLDVTPRIKDPHLQALHKACREAMEFTHYQLDTLDAKNVKEYLMRRNITEEIIKRFEIGWMTPCIASCMPKSMRMMILCPQVLYVLPPSE